MLAGGRDDPVDRLSNARARLIAIRLTGRSSSRSSDAALALTRRSG